MLTLLAADVQFFPFFGSWRGISLPTLSFLTIHVPLSAQILPLPPSLLRQEAISSPFFHAASSFPLPVGIWLDDPLLDETT